MKIHFIGINGVSMRVLAALAGADGYEVSGSDSSLSGHNAANVDGADIVVKTCAVGPDNVEILRAKELNIPVVERAEFLGKIAQSYKNVIAVAGSHGKTTTTGMLWKIFAHESPTVHIGGNICGGGCFLGGKEFFITEACEYNRSFLCISPSVAVVLNVDLDHTDCYKDIFDLIKAFKEFVSGAQKQVIINGDDINASLINAAVPCVTVGMTERCDYYAGGVSCDSEGRFSFCAYGKSRRIGNFYLSVPGRHNIYNALAAIACADFYGIGYDRIRHGLADFFGMERRFECVGEYSGAKVFSDYAHHPGEIQSSIMTARAMGAKKIISVFEPHTYSRTKSFLDGFATTLSLSDDIIILPVYAARESDSRGVTSIDILRKIISAGRNAIYFATYYETVSYLRETVEEGSIILFMGAGDIDKAARIMVNKNFYD